MATYQILYWQDIPSQVNARDAGANHKEPLSPRFQELIDLVAMKKHLVGSEEYVAAWTKGGKEERPGAAPDVARAVAAELEARYEEFRQAALAQSGGR